MAINQAYLFLIFTINGVIIGILFDTFRILRKSFKTNDIFTYVEDILFWILTGIILLYSIFTFSNGEIRFYMFIGIFLGCIIYMLLISKYFIEINVKIILSIKKVISIIFSPIIYIIKIFKKLFFKPIHFVTINMQKIYINRKKNIKKMIKQQNITEQP